MSLRRHVEDVPEGRSGFFIGAAESDNVSEKEDHHQFVIEKANALASDNCLKEAVHWFSVARGYGPVRPEQFSTFVDCVLRDFKRTAAGVDSLCGPSRTGSGDDVFDCPGCHSFLGEPVTVACGHTYCKRCLQRRLLSKCKLCGEAMRGDEKTNVLLCGLLDKWFPDELKKSKTLREVDDLCGGKRFHEAVSLASNAIQTGTCL